MPGRPCRVRALLGFTTEHARKPVCHRTTSTQATQARISGLSTALQDERQPPDSQFCGCMPSACPAMPVRTSCALARTHVVELSPCRPLAWQPTATTTTLSTAHQVALQVLAFAGCCFSSTAPGSRQMVSRSPFTERHAAGCSPSGTPHPAHRAALRGAYTWRMSQRPSSRCVASARPHGSQCTQRHAHSTSEGMALDSASSLGHLQSVMVEV